MGDDRRKTIERMVRRVTERKGDHRVVDVVERCLKKGYDSRKMKERLGEVISDSNRVSKLVNYLLDEFPQLKGDKHKFEEVKREPVPRVKQEAPSRPADSSKPPSQVPESDAKKGTEDDLRGKELMYQAQMAIEARKRELNLSTPANVTTGALKRSTKLEQHEASLYIKMSQEKLDRVNRVAELKQKVANRHATLGLDRKPLLQSVTIEPPVEYQTAAGGAPVAVEEPPGDYVDPRVLQKGAARRRRTMKFHEKGEFEQLANRQRAKAKLEKLQEEIARAARNTGISSAVKLAMVTPNTEQEREIPDIEWWDAVVLEGKGYDSIPSEKTNEWRYATTISHYIEHPIQLKPPDEPLQPQYLRVYLTKHERKKIRRQTRKESQREKTEKIRLGLEKAPEPKMKLSNLMRVLGNDAVQDPTRIEAHVRRQMVERLRKHESANEERRLSKEQRAAKSIKKRHEDTSMGVHVAIYRLKSLAHPAKKFKVEMNAKQLQMTGLLLLHKDLSIVVVEGGPKQQKFFKNLMLTRIKWAEEIIGQKKEASDANTPGERNQCVLVWEGVVKKRAFGDVRCHAVTLEKQAREMLDRHGVAHYWDLAYGGAVLLDPADNKVI